MSLTDKLTREHKMTADEARLILNVGKDSGVDAMMKVSKLLLYCHQTNALLSHL